MEICNNFVLFFKKKQTQLTNTNRYIVGIVIDGKSISRFVFEKVGISVIPSCVSLIFLFYFKLYDEKFKIK